MIEQTAENVARVSADETGNAGGWGNSFIDNLDGIISQVVHVVHDVSRADETMLNRNQDADETTQGVADTILPMLALLQNKISEIRQAADTAEDMRQVMENVVSNTKAKLQTVWGKPQSVRNTIDTSAHAIYTPNQRADKIGNMGEESLPSVEDAASDNNGLHDIIVRLLAAIQQITRHNKHHNTNTVNIAASTKNLRHIMGKLQQTVSTMHATIDKMGQLLSQVQISARE